jgi:hypothetical protein
MFKVEAGIRLAGIEDTMKKSLREKGMSEDLIEDTIEEMRLGVRAGVAYGVDRDGSEVGTQDIFGIQGAEETYNTFYGLLAGYNNTGKYNSFFGSAAGYNTKGNDNSMMGYLAGYSNTTGDSNTFMGSHAGFKNTIGWSNTFIGQEAGYENSTGAGNVFLGAYAGYYETGYAKLYVDNTPTSSPLIWGDFGSNIVAVHGKFGIGTKSPDYQMEIETTGENAILLLDRTDGATTGFSASGDKCAFGTLSNHPLYCVINGVFTMILQTNGSLHMSSGAYCTAAGKWVDASSREYKENIQELTVQEAMDALEGLNPVKYNYKKEKGKEYVGFIAEDVPELVATKNRKGMSSMDVVAVLTKVLQEQQIREREQQEIIDELRERIAELERMSQKEK